MLFMDTNAEGGAEVPVEDSEQDTELPQQQLRAEDQQLPAAVKADSDRWENLQNNVGTFTAKDGFWFEDQEIGWCWTEDRRNVISCTLLCEDLIDKMRRENPTPLTEVIVRLCSKMDPEQRLWFLKQANSHNWDPDTVRYEAENRVGVWGTHQKPKAQKLWSWGKDRPKRQAPEPPSSSSREPEPQPQGMWRDYSQQDAEEEMKQPDQYSNLETREYYNQRPVDMDRCQEECCRRVRDDPANRFQTSGLCCLPCCLEHRHAGEHLCRGCEEKTRSDGDDNLGFNHGQPIRGIQQQRPGPYVSPAPYFPQTKRPYQPAQSSTWTPLELRRTSTGSGHEEEHETKWRRHGID